MRDNTVESIGYATIFVKEKIYTERTVTNYASEAMTDRPE